MRTLVIGDIHAGLKALEQLLERAKVTKEDHLILLLPASVQSMMPGDSWVQRQTVRRGPTTQRAQDQFERSDRA